MPQAAHQVRRMRGSLVRDPLRLGGARRHAPVLPNDPLFIELRDLLRLRDTGDVRWIHARNEYLTKNDRMACDFARRFWEKARPTELAQEDFVQAAREGCVIAIGRMDLTRAQRFSSAARWWMFNRCMELFQIELLHTANVPKEARKLLSEVEELGPISTETAADVLGVSVEEIVDAQKLHGYRLDHDVDDLPGDEDPDEVIALRRALSRLNPRELAAIVDAYEIHGECTLELLPQSPTLRRALKELALKRLRRMIGE